MAIIAFRIIALLIDEKCGRHNGDRHMPFLGKRVPSRAFQQGIRKVFSESSGTTQQAVYRTAIQHHKYFYMDKDRPERRQM
ncbi:hypothetical protein D7S89_20205 [Trinickia fusca]|uniref:Uncharacterized protein n=1 Tax=Trinickia fusca TaxID=2419777 RepID=A0A494X492_9BURK|nr:hypothetical protein D7S89_20205 [Trinickia fusca]